MTEPTGAGESSRSEIQDQLHAVVQTLRDADHLDVATQEELADLVQELSDALGSATIPETEIEHLLATSKHLQEALREQHAGPIAHARERLDQAIIAIDTRAPFVAGIARRLADALSNIGI